MREADFSSTQVKLNTAAAASPRHGDASSRTLNSKASLHDLHVKACQLKGLQSEKALLWDYFNKKKQSELLFSSTQTLEESHLQMDQDIDVDIGSSSVARGVIGLVLGYVTSIVVDLAIVIKGLGTMYSNFKVVVVLCNRRHLSVEFLCG